MKASSLRKISIAFAVVSFATVVAVSVSMTTFVSKDDRVVVDPKSKQRVFVDELVIFAEGKDVASIVAEYDGVITISVPQTETYQARFRVKSLRELDAVASKLRKRGLKVQYVIVRKPPGPNEPQ
jgi:hypothetical protein